METIIFASDLQASKKAARLLNQMSGRWKKDITCISVFRFAAFICSAICLVAIAGLLSNLTLHAIGQTRFIYSLLNISFWALCKILFNYCADRTAASLTGKVTGAVRRDMLSTIVAGGIPFLQKDLSGGIAVSFMNKADAISPYFTRYIPQIILCIAAPFVTLVYLFTVSWVCGLIVFLTVPAIPVFMMIIGKGTEAKSNEQWQILSQMGGDFMDRLKGVTTLYLFGQLKNQSGRVRESSAQYSKSVLEVLKVAFLSAAVLEFFSAIIIASVAIYIGLNMMHYIHWGTQSPFTLRNGLVVLLLIPEFFLSLKTLGNYYHDKTRALGVIMNLRESNFFHEVENAPPPEYKGDMNTKESSLVSRPIRFGTTTPPPIIFDHIHFYYNKQENILKDFNLAIQPGEKIKITGENGSGKTTLISLLLGWYKPNKGIIHIGDYTVQQYNETDLYQIIGWIGQQTSIFEGTIRSNIMMGSLMNDEELWETVLKPVSLDSYLRQLPFGLDTPVAEDGKSISGGERQKIALARALVKNTPVLLLDEPLSHLDKTSSVDFLDALDRVAKNKTIIMTGHGESYLAVKGYRQIKLNKNA